MVGSVEETDVVGGGALTHPQPPAPVWSRTMNRWAEKLGRLIHEAREEKRWTQEELAERVGVTGATISRWENGKAHPRDQSKMVALINALDLSASSSRAVSELVARLQDQPFRRRVAYAAGEIEAGNGKVLHVGTHSVELQKDGSLLVNGHIQIEPE